MKMIIKVLLLFFPWKIRRWLLVKNYKYDIHPTARIGLAYVYPHKLIMGEHSYIRDFTVAVNCDKIELSPYASISRQCWITGFPTGTKSAEFSYDNNRKAELILGEHSKIMKKHHIDCTNQVKIGKFVTIAGYDSQILTHSINIHTNRQESNPVEIGEYSFVSTKVVILGGSRLPSYSILGAGAVLNKYYDDDFSYNLFGGLPAKPVKKLSTDEPYFLRDAGAVK
ncbi:hypothetical protein FACS189429_3970 [Bacteroidia bacterium]|nr:hypothetical protein FACS189429_3970 [Bacteroidia bacterium]